jgi:hypothetical protein
MSAYRGTVTITLSGLLDGTTPFSAFAPITIDLFGASLAGDGTLTGTFAGSGPITVNTANGSGSDFITFPSTPFSTPIANPVLPFDSSVPGLTITWSESNTFSAQRTSVTTVGMGTFSGSVNGMAASGTINASGTLSAVTSAYHIAASGALRAEGDSGTTPYTFTVTRLGATSGFSTIAWQVPAGGPGGAIATDFAGFTMPGGTLAFTAGETTKTITVDVLGDELIEADESFTVTLANDPGEVIAVTSSVRGTIVADDFATISIAPLAAEVAEGPGFARTPFTFTVTRSGSTVEGASVEWAVNGVGTSPYDPDFADVVRPTGTISFLPGETSQILTVFVNGDPTPEPQESFTVDLSNPTGGAGLGTSSAVGLIINDDGGIHQVADSTAADETFAMGDGDDLVRFSAPRSSYRIGMLGNRIHVEGPDGTDELTDVEWLKFGTEPALTREALRAQPATDELMGWFPAGGTSTDLRFLLPMRYTGPLDLAYVYPGTSGDDLMSGTSLNDFFNLGDGNDAASMAGGNDIVDGGGGNNFLGGGAGIDQFFLDGRFATPVWSCIEDWEIGESLTLWGWQPGTSVGAWGENAGLAGYLGATFFADIDGSGAVETVVTFTGRAVAEMPAPAMLDVGGIGVLKFG